MLVKAGKSFLKEFRDFAMRGNVFDMAIGVVIGTAFSKIVSSLVGDIIMPLIGLVVGRVDLKALSLTLQEKSADTEAVILAYGSFLQTIFDFTLIALAIFMSMKLINRLKRAILTEDSRPEAAGPQPDAPDVAVLKEIRDLLKSRREEPEK